MQEAFGALFCFLESGEKGLGQEVFFGTIDVGCFDFLRPGEKGATKSTHQHSQNFRKIER